MPHLLTNTRHRLHNVKEFWAFLTKVSFWGQEEVRLQAKLEKSQKRISVAILFYFEQFWKDQYHSNVGLLNMGLQPAAGKLSLA